jgi:hypothetical protein
MEKAISQMGNKFKVELLIGLVGKIVEEKLFYDKMELLR